MHAILARLAMYLRVASYRIYIRILQEILWLRCHLGAMTTGQKRHRRADERSARRKAKLKAKRRRQRARAGA